MLAIGILLAILWPTLRWPAAAPAAPTAADLQLPAAAFPGVVEVATRALAVDDGRQGEDLPSEIVVLRRESLGSAAQYRYRLEGEPPGRFRVRIDVFGDAATAAARFRGRHLPEALAMTEPLAVGDDGFIYLDEYAGFRVGPVAVEIRAEATGGRLADFARAYARFVAERLQRPP